METNTKQRFDIATALAGTFKGIAEGVETNLHQASRCGDCEWITKILNGKRSFHSFSEERKDSGKVLINASKKMVNERNKLGATSLWLAAVMGHVEAVELLIQSGADLEIPDIKAQTPLYAAAKFNHVGCARALLEAGARPDGSDSNITTPIYVAARDNYPEILQLLIRHNADVNGRHGKNHCRSSCSDYRGNSPVYISLVYRHFECFRLLVLGGADLCLPPATNGAGESTSLLNGILRYACDARYLELLYLCGGTQTEDLESYVRMYRDRTNGLGNARKECVEFLIECKAQPMRLSDLIRVHIRRRLGQERLRFIPELTLPTRIKAFISIRFALHSLFPVSSFSSSSSHFFIFVFLSNLYFLFSLKFPSTVTTNS